MTIVEAPEPEPIVGVPAIESPALAVELPADESAQLTPAIARKCVETLAQAEGWPTPACNLTARAMANLWARGGATLAEIRAAVAESTRTSATPNVGLAVHKLCQPAKPAGHRVGYWGRPSSPSSSPRRAGYRRADGSAPLEPRPMSRVIYAPEPAPLQTAEGAASAAAIIAAAKAGRISEFARSMSASMAMSG